MPEKKNTSLKIDVHTHWMPKDLPDFGEKFGYGDFIYLDHYREGTARMMQGNTFFREVGANTWDPELRVVEYAKKGVQQQVICIIPVLFYYWAREQDGAYTSRYFNEAVAKICQNDPAHYLGLGTLPMQSPELAVEEVKTLKSLGLKGVQIGSNINDINLEEPRFFPVYEALESEGLCLFVHPWNMMGMRKMRKYWLPWLVGMPAETSRAVCSMLFGGVFERFPKLRVCFAHAGGSFFGTFGRIVHGYHCRPDLVAIDNPVDPREYLGHFWVDGITHDEKTLEFVVDMVGSKRVMLGSDYPFPLGDLELGAFIEHTGLSQAQKQDLYADSAKAWLGLE